jgi:hypothetical protein
MRQEVQWYLTEALANARAMMGLQDALERRHVTVAGYSSALAALRYVGEVSEVEEQDWRNRMLEAVGITPPGPSPPGTIQFVFVGNPDDQPRRPRVNVPRFVRSVIGPDLECELHGGRLRVLAADIYDTTIDIRWRVAPEPDIASVFPTEMSQLNRDVAGTDEWAAEHLRNKGAERLRMMRLYEFELNDDVGTPYMRKGGGHGGGGGETTGNARFIPAPPSAAAELTLTWQGVDVKVALT